jgi:hypothetical protein
MTDLTRSVASTDTPEAACGGEDEGRGSSSDACPVLAGSGQARPACDRYGNLEASWRGSIRSW